MKATQPPQKPTRKQRKYDFSVAAFAVAVVAVASALIVGAPSAMLGSAVSLNPGPAMVAATSVAPAFLAAPTKH